MRQMLRKGYVQQQVERLGSSLAHILGLKGDGSTEAAREAVQRASKELTNMDLEVLAALPDPTMMSLFGLGSAVDPARAYAAGMLLMEQADLVDDPAPRRRKALLLLTEAMLHESSLRTDDTRARVAALIEKVGAEGHLTAPVRYHLLRYFEGIGDFAKAEDQIYAVEEMGDPKARETALWLYNRLSRLPDALLIRGGLSREEVDEELARWQQQG
jgi:hypothetical protein